jgi:hypothetical protein
MAEKPAAARGKESAEAAALSVEGVPPRDTVVTFSKQFASYFPGESAAFTPDEAARLDALGVTGGAGGAPVNVDVPVVSQSGDELTSTMGNWDGEPTSYAYAWQLDGSEAGADAATLTVTTDDAGKTATCVVTATNAAGSTAAPPSAGLVVADPEARADPHRGRRGR